MTKHMQNVFNANAVAALARPAIRNNAIERQRRAASVQT